MANITVGTPMDLEDFLALPEGPPYYELIDGRLEMAASPFSFHQRVVLKLSVYLYQQLEEKGWGKLFIAPLDVVLG